MSKLLGKSSTYEHIIAYMTDEEGDITKLSAHEQELIKRWNEAYTLLRSGKSQADAAAILMKRFTMPGGQPISRATAYRDCSNALALFGDISKSSKEGIKHLSTEMVRDAYTIAKAKNDPDTMIKASVAIAKINGVNNNDPDLPDFAKLEPNTYILQLDPLTLRAIEHLIKTGRIELQLVADAMNEIAEEVEFEEVKVLKQ